MQHSARVYHVLAWIFGSLLFHGMMSSSMSGAFSWRPSFNMEQLMLSNFGFCLPVTISRFEVTTMNDLNMKREPFTS